MSIWVVPNIEEWPIGNLAKKIRIAMPPGSQVRDLPGAPFSESIRKIC